MMIGFVLVRFEHVERIIESWSHLLIPKLKLKPPKLNLPSTISQQQQHHHHQHQQQRDDNNNMDDTTSSSYELCHFNHHLHAVFSYCPFTQL